LSPLRGGMLAGARDEVYFSVLKTRKMREEDCRLPILGLRV